MSLTQLANGEFLLGKWHERAWDNEKEKEYFKEFRYFRYKTYDDTQERENEQQRQMGGRTTLNSLSIHTSSSFDFKRGDKIELVDEGIILNISTVEKVKNTPYAMSNMFAPKLKRYPKRLHLNKGG